MVSELISAISVSRYPPLALLLCTIGFMLFFWFIVYIYFFKINFVVMKQQHQRMEKN